MMKTCSVCGFEIIRYAPTCTRCGISFSPGDQSAQDQ
jgi:hypothetical protein